MDKYPDQHIPRAVKTAISFPVIKFFSNNFGTSPSAAPTLPKAVSGNAMHSDEVNPNNGFKMGFSNAPSFGIKPTPS